MQPGISLTRKVLRILVGGTVGSALIATASLAASSNQTRAMQAYGAAPECPPGWEARSTDGRLERFDQNDDGVVCTKDVSGRGNVGDGRVAKDNNTDD